jgi:hypothetical protein
MTIEFNWPDKLGDVSFDFTGTELWFLRENCDSGNVATGGEVQRFGYFECFVELGEDAYLFKYKHQVSYGAQIGGKTNIVFYIKKL